VVLSEICGRILVQVQDISPPIFAESMGDPVSHTDYISRRLPVPPEWDEVFSHFYYAANRSGKPVKKKLLPTFQTILVFSFGPAAQLLPGEATPVSVEKSMVIGPIKKSLQYVLPSGNEILVANLKADTFYRFFARSLRSRQDMMLHPDELLEKHCFSDLWQELAEIPSVEKKMEKILAFSADYLRKREAASEELLQATDDAAINSVKQIAGKIEKSERTVQLNYKKYLGYSEKELNRYKRFQETIFFINNTYKPGHEIDWFEVIHHGGYYDQSHLIHDFNYYIGISPKQYLKLQEEMCVGVG
jgi:AraC-like DNA-binding protein